MEKEKQIEEITSNLQKSSIMMTSSFHKAVSEAKRQYDAIDQALEVSFRQEFSQIFTKFSF
jgi:hypothetical protein